MRAQVRGVAEGEDEVARAFLDGLLAGRILAGPLGIGAVQRAGDELVQVLRLAAVVRHLLQEAHAGVTTNHRREESVYPEWEPIPQGERRDLEWEPITGGDRVYDRSGDQ